MQGLGDEEIPPERALELSDAISSRDVIVTYVKYGKHALDDFEDDFRCVCACGAERECCGEGQEARDEGGGE